MKTFSQLRIYQRLRHAHIENKGLKLLSLGLAILLFAVSRQPVSDVHLRGVPIEYHGLAAGLEILGNSEQTVNLRLRGPRNVVRNLMSNQLSVVADLTNKEQGERVIQLSADRDSLPDNTKVLQIEPPALKLRIERTEKKLIPVEAQYVGQVAQGMEIYNIGIDPQTIEIEGPQSLVKKTQHVLTETIGLGGRRDSFTASAEIETPNNALRLTTTRTVTLSIEIGERRINRKFTNVPLYWLNQPLGGQSLVSTVEVELFGPQSVIQSLRSEELSAEATATDLPAGVNSVLPHLKLPENVASRIQIKTIFPKEVKVKKQ